MTYELAIGDRTYSSWSLRGWLMFAKWDITVRVRTARLYSDELPQLLKDFAPARLVPAMKKDGIVVHDTLAMAETLAEAYPERNMWPAHASARATARSITAEMHSGFGALREACPMNLAHTWAGFEPSPEVLADCARIEELWQRALTHSDGPWLFGDYSLADVFYAPIATRFATYDLPRGAVAARYIDTVLSDQTFRQWRAMGLAENHHQPFYDMPLAKGDWPGPEAVPARAVEGGQAENDACPYSGKPVTHFLETGGRVYGFCNAFCRDKTVADPEAWPRFTDMLSA